MIYPIIINGDHAEFEAEHVNTKPEDRPDWPLPSFDARDWADAFVGGAFAQSYRDNKGLGIDRDTMVTWFANALMRGYDQHVRNASDDQ